MNEIVLVVTPSPFLTDERVFPSLGILKVASALEMNGIGVDVLDLSGIGNYVEVMETYLRQNKTRFVGITATSPQFPYAVEISNASRELGAKTILGGPHATMVASAFKLDQKRSIRARGTLAYEQMLDLFDVCVVGDGELAIVEAMQTDEGVVFADDRKSPLFLKRGTLDNYPFPARHLIDMDSYHYSIDGFDAQSMIAQLGCPFYCQFCGGRNTHSFRAIRTRGVESIMEEIDLLVKKYGKRGIMFYDDELNVSNATLVPLLEHLIRYQEKEKVELRLRGFVKAELFTRQQAELMYRAGFRIMLSGVESGDDRILDVMRKRTTRETNSRWVKLCRDAGLQVKALMSIGHAGESEESIMNSLQWVLENKPDEVDWTVITQYPGSPYFDESVPHGDEWVFEDSRTGELLFSKDVNYAEEGNYYKGIPGDYTSFVWTEHLSAEKLVELRDMCENVSRRALGLPAIMTVVAQQFEHSMGQRLPDSILRSSK